MTEFNKYRDNGAYHWKQTKKSLFNDQYNPLLEGRYSALLKAIPHFPDQTVRFLEIGCGDGYLIHLLNADKNRLNYGLEYDIDGVKLAHDTLLTHNSNSMVTQGTVYQTPFKDHSFDVVILADVIEHLENESQVIKEVHRILRPGGFLIISTPNRQSEGMWDNNHVREYNPSEIQSALNIFFKDIHISGYWNMKYVQRWRSGSGWKKLYSLMSLLGMNPFTLRVKNIDLAGQLVVSAVK